MEGTQQHSTAQGTTTRKEHGWDLGKNETLNMMHLCNPSRSHIRSLH